MSVLKDKFISIYKYYKNFEKVSKFSKKWPIKVRLHYPVNTIISYLNRCSTDLVLNIDFDTLMMNLKQQVDQDYKPSLK